MDADRIFFFVIAVLLALAVGYWGSTRKIGFGWAFFLSILNLLIGIIAVTCSKKIEKKDEPINDNER